MMISKTISHGNMGTARQGGRTGVAAEPLHVMHSHLVPSISHYAAAQSISADRVFSGYGRGMMHDGWWPALQHGFVPASVVPSFGTTRPPMLGSSPIGAIEIDSCGSGRKLCCAPTCGRPVQAHGVGRDLAK